MAPRPAARVAGLGPTLIRAIGEGAPADAIPLALGEPSWELPAPARAALTASAGTCSYGPNAGLPELRAAIAARHAAAPEEVLVTVGAQGALFALFQAWLGPGDAVLVPDPGFPAYAQLARLAGATPVPYPLAADQGFRLDAAALVAVLDRTPQARVVVVNHPANPTGAGATAAALARVAAACRRRGLLLVSDEVYRELAAGPPLPGLRAVAADGVVVESVSKGWGAPGLRVGWAVGDRRWLAPALAVHAAAATAAARPAQQAALALLAASAEVLSAARGQLEWRWRALATAWSAAFGAPPRRPDGAFYLWLPLPSTARRDPLAFCLRLRDEGRVLVVPGLAFGERGAGWLRLSFAALPEQVAEGVRRLAPFLAEAA